MHCAVFELGGSSAGGFELGCASGYMTRVEFNISGSIIDQVTSITCTGSNGVPTDSYALPVSVEVVTSTGPCYTRDGGLKSAKALLSNGTTAISMVGMSGADGTNYCYNLGTPAGVSNRRLVVSGGGLVQGSCNGSNVIIGVRNKVDRHTTALGFICAGENLLPALQCFAFSAPHDRKCNFISYLSFALLLPLTTGQLPAF